MRPLLTARPVFRRARTSRARFSRRPGRFASRRACYRALTMGAAHVPQRNVAVGTGASQSDRGSVSIAQTVIEQHKLSSAHRGLARQPARSRTNADRRGRDLPTKTFTPLRSPRSKYVDLTVLALRVAQSGTVKSHRRL